MLFLFSQTVFSQPVSSTLFFFSFQFSPPSHWEEGGMSEQLCGPEPPAGLNHNILSLQIHTTISADVD